MERQVDVSDEIKLLYILSSLGLFLTSIILAMMLIGIGHVATIWLTEFFLVFGIIVSVSAITFYLNPVTHW